jgi:hypothetical protein
VSVMGMLTTVIKRATVFFLKLQLVTTPTSKEPTQAEHLRSPVTPKTPVRANARESFTPEGHHRIHLRGAPGRKIARQKSDAR